MFLRALDKLLTASWLCLALFKNKNSLKLFPGDIDKLFYTQDIDDSCPMRWLAGQFISACLWTLLSASIAASFGYYLGLN